MAVPKKYFQLLIPRFTAIIFNMLITHGENICHTALFLASPYQISNGTLKSQHNNRTKTEQIWKMKNLIPLVRN